MKCCSWRREQADNVRNMLDRSFLQENGKFKFIEKRIVVEQINKLNIQKL